MAYENQARTTTNEKPKAGGYINLKVVDKSGKSHALRTGVPLMDNIRTEHFILEAARKAEEAGQEEFTVEVVASVNLVKSIEEQPAIEF